MLAFIAFLGCVAAHLALVLVVAKRAWWRGVVALLVPPLAVWWAWARGARRRVWLWVSLVVAYAVIATIASGGSP